jgi:uroporphyrinogen-III decarboxylase
VLFRSQAVEKELMRREGYEEIVSRGYKRWFFNHLATLWGIRSRFPLCMPWIMPRLLGVNVRTARIMRAWAARGVAPGFDSACYPPFDLFSLVRSAERFFFDLADIPDEVEAAMQASIGSIVQMASMPLRFGGGSRICIYPMRSSASFISPAMFERFSFPYLKRMVEGFHKAGIVSVLHCDGNWTPMLGFLAALPPKSCIVELDGETDIFEAKRVLGGRLCLKGNVPASLLAFGTRNQVLDYCARLTREVGAGGGFILSSGCEVPLNARPENVKAMVDAVTDS